MVGATPAASAALKTLIPGFETMSPRTKAENAVAYIVKELKAKSLKAANVYRMADTANAGKVQASALEAAFKKLLPNIKPEVVSEAMKAFKAAKLTDIITS